MESDAPGGGAPRDGVLSGGAPGGGDPLAAAGWRAGRDAGDAAMLAVLTTVAVGQGRVFPAAERALREFHGLRIAPAPDGGREVAATGCVVDPARPASRARSSTGSPVTSAYGSFRSDARKRTHRSPSTRRAGCTCSAPAGRGCSARPYGRA
ncbi:SUKH-3 domain-containing protein [Streptomyces diastatochromogenes]|nr:SUKH-3 domain-containing protein [Streptomyces diastatochromogenes]